GNGPPVPGRSALDGNHTWLNQSSHLYRAKASRNGGIQLHHQQHCTALYRLRSSQMESLLSIDCPPVSAASFRLPPERIHGSAGTGFIATTTSNFAAFSSGVGVQS